MPKKTMFPRLPCAPLCVLAGLSLLALGCNGTGSGEVDSEATQTTGSSIGMSSTSPPTGTAPTTGETSDGTVGTASESSSGGSSSSSSSSTGPDAPPLAESCAALCELSQGCVPSPYPDLESCLWSCNRNDDQAMECVDSLSLYSACLSELSCTEYGDALMGKSTSCDGEAGMIGETCDICPFSILSDTDENCSMVESCAGEAQIEFRCEKDVCTCLVDGEAQGECPGEGVCGEDFGARAEAANACCGFVL